MKPISVVILTHNEEKNIVRAINSVVFADEIIVQDDHSDDNTISLAKKNHARVVSYDGPDNFSKRRNDALALAKHEWVLFIDADEVVTQELAREIKELTSSNEVSGYSIRRVDFFWNHPMRYGEAGSSWIVRLVHREKGAFTRPVHEVWNGKTIKRLRNEINHYPHQTVKEFIQKIDRYSTLNARHLHNGDRSTNALDILVTPIGKFLYTYFIKLGFKDGAAGFVYSFMMSFHSFLTRSKLYLLTHEKNP